MKSIQKALLCAGLCFVAHSNANEIPIYNGNFDAAYLDDGSSFSQVNNWHVESGFVGVINPASTYFVGEEGEGMHSNTLYMVDYATVSQTLGFKAQENTVYTLSFDVGQRSDLAIQDHIIVVKAGDKELLYSRNAVLPSAPGTFARTTLQFSSDSNSAEQLTLEVQARGIGQTYFDNFSMSYEREISKEKAYLKPVAYGTELRFGDQQAGPCTLSQALNSEESSGTYMVALNDGCRCNDSQKVLVASHLLSNNEQYKDFYQCVISSEQ